MKVPVICRIIYEAGVCVQCVSVVCPHVGGILGECTVDAQAHAAREYVGRSVGIGKLTYVHKSTEALATLNPQFAFLRLFFFKIEKNGENWSRSCVHCTFIERKNAVNILCALDFDAEHFGIHGKINRSTSSESTWHFNRTK